MYTRRASGPVTRKYMGRLYGFRNRMIRANAQGARGRKRG